MSLKSLAEIIREHKHEIALISLIIMIGIFFRAYNFSDWLQFETDQVDDILITEPSIMEGIEKLKLLGPKAGAELLRLPPGFYYSESISARIFGNTPAGHAFPVLFFSCLSLPLFYFFSRIYFSSSISKVLLAMIASSFYMVLYGRFSWNPNLLPFFVLATLYTLLKSISHQGTHNSKWFIALFVLFGFSSQLHYNALFILGAIIVTALLIKRPVFNWKVWTIALSVFLFMHTPLIVHEIKTDGMNTRLFFEKVNSDSSDTKRQESPIDNLIQNFRYGAGEYFLIVFGNDQINDGHLQGNSLGLFCTSCLNNFFPRLVGYIFYLSGIFLLFFNLYREKDPERKNFLLICSLWFVFSFLYFWNLLNNKLYLYPRFFLLLSPLPFIFIGLILEKIHLKKSRVLIGLSALIVSTALIVNLLGLNNHFLSLSEASLQPMELAAEDVFPNTKRAPLDLHKKIIDEIIQQTPDKDIPVYLLSESEYEPVYWYLLNKSGVEYWKSLDNMIDEKEFFAEGYYFIVYQTLKLEDKGFKNKLSYFQIISQKEFGSLVLFQLKPKQEWQKKSVQDLLDKNVLTEQCQAERILDWEDMSKNTAQALEKASKKCKK